MLGVDVDVDVLDDVDVVVEVDVVALVEEGVEVNVSATSLEGAVPECALAWGRLGADDGSTVAVHAEPTMNIPNAIAPSVAGRFRRSWRSRRCATSAVWQRSLGVRPRPTTGRRAVRSAT